MHLIVYPDIERLAEGVADMVAEVVAGAAHVALGLAGGSTPRRAYEVLRNRPLPWERVDAWLADERWIPFDHPECNGAMADAALFAHVEARLHPTQGSGAPTPKEAAGDYETLLRRILPHHEGRYRADLVLLGVGDDGHTASLFPETEALQEDRRLYVANWVPMLGTWRLTATLPLLHAARRLAFLVAGVSKAAVVHSILEEEADLPAFRAMQGDAEAFWLLDAAAASRLGGRAE